MGPTMDPLRYMCGVSAVDTSRGNPTPMGDEINY